MSVPLLSLRRGQCRFPITPHEAPSHRFCAVPVEREGATYCHHHAEICFDRRSLERRQADHERMAMMRAQRMVIGGAATRLPARILKTTESTLLDGDVA